MFVKISIHKLYMELSIENRSISFVFRTKDKYFTYEKHFPKHFKCVVCKCKVEDEDQKIKMCEQHQYQFINYVGRKLKQDGLL